MTTPTAQDLPPCHLCGSRQIVGSNGPVVMRACQDAGSGVPYCMSDLNADAAEAANAPDAPARSGVAWW